MKKLQNDHARLPLLGDGTQKKSYLYVKDGVRGIMLGIEKAPAQKNIYNLGHDYFIPVINVVEVVLDELGMRDVILDFAGGQRGWMGNSPLVHLDTTKLKRMGWRPEVSIEEGIRRTTRFLREILFSCMNAAEVQRRLIKFLAVWLRDGGTLNKLKTIAVI